METFNAKYKAWKQNMIDMINNGGIPLAVVDDFLATLKSEIAVTLAQEEMQVKEAESVEEEERSGAPA